MIELHYWTTPNGHKITIFLEEGGLPYRIVPVNISAGDQFKNDPFFLPAGAEACTRDHPDAEIHLLDAGHFALESQGPEIAAIIRDFLARKLPKQVRAA
jgi:pimeloyl-ACP methyl ester carboxylesterase